MKIVITEEQLKSIVISEQNLWNRIKTGAQNIYNGFDNAVKSNPMLNNSKMMGSGPAGSAIGSIQMDPHTRNSILEALWGIVPVAGPFIASAIGLTDARKYYQEGNPREAVIVGVLSALPLIGQIANKFPIIKQLTKEGMETLAQKIVSGTGTLSNIEQQVMNIINDNSGVIVNHVKTLAKSPIAKNYFQTQAVRAATGAVYDTTIK